MAGELHRRNLRALYRQLYGELPVYSFEEEDLEEEYDNEDYEEDE